MDGINTRRNHMDNHGNALQIISASRRTDIPNHYAPWFLQRVKEGYVYVRNARDFHQIQQVDLSPEAVACVVFWTKNPEPLTPYLHLLSSYHYYFQYTINAYGQDIEPKTPPMGESVDRFRRLADLLGPDRVIWRYDPIFINKSYPLGYHVETFSYLARKLSGYTKRCTISFLDMYKNTAIHAKSLSLSTMSDSDIRKLVANMVSQALLYGISISTCAESIDLEDLGVEHGSCIDPRLIERITGYDMTTLPQSHQRPHCRCAPSVDIGMYNTCLNMCAYCYANYAENQIHGNYSQARTSSPLQIGVVGKNDTIYKRAIRRGSAQLSLFG
jgi:hypothetical protein